MAITIAFVREIQNANPPRVIADITFDNNYPAGGYTVNPSDLHLKDVHSFAIAGKGAGSRIFEYDFGQPNGKLKIFTALATEAVGASDQSAIVARVVATGPHI